MAIPKAACVKSSILLHQLEGLKLPANTLTRQTPGITFVSKLTDFSNDEAIDILTSKTWYRFCIVRNPYTRIFSAYKDKVLPLTSPWKGFRKNIREMFGYPELDDASGAMVSFRDFVRYVARQSDRDRDAHWKTQTGTIHLNDISYDMIGHIETYERDFKQVLDRFGAPSELTDTLAERVNVNIHQIPHAAVYDRDLADQVFEIYKEDFESLGYPRGSWMYV
jgi:hypothetical protein